MRPSKLAVVFVVSLSLLLLGQVAWSEYRTWTAASGGFSVDAEFVELREGRVVRLRLKSGELRDVPLDKLSQADRQFVNKLAAASSNDPRLAKLEHDVARAGTAEEGLRLYRVFHDDPQTTDAQRAAIAGKMAEFRELAAKKLVRMGNKWVSDEELQRVRKQANSLMKQGLELLRLKQEDAFRKKFAEAAALEPDSVRADFFFGILYGVIAHDNASAEKRFEACLKRDPENVAVLNNLALTEMKLRNPRDAVLHWRKAIELGPDQSIVQNLGRFLEQAGSEHLKVPKNLIETVSSAYASLIADGKFSRADLKRGWMYDLLDEGTLLDLGEKSEAKVESNVPPPSEDGAKVIGGGTGFVVAPGFILTNHHVVEHGTSFDVQVTEGMQTKTYPAKVIATSKTPDLALLECTQVSGQPLPLDPKLSHRGTDIMALGYPEMFNLGASLKATRGVISAVPSSTLDDMYLYDAVINPGNSGGPVCDHHGNVLAVTTVLIMTAGKYGGGIPSPAALEFVKKFVPNYQSPPLGTEVLEWPAVDEKVSPSTVLIWARSKSAESTAAVPADRLEDRSCMICNGLGIIRCINPGCVRGVATVSKNGRMVRDTCPLCKGKALIVCPICKGTGIDPALKTSKPSEPPRSSPPPTSPPPAVGAKPGQHPPLSPEMAQHIRELVASGRTYDTPRSGTGGTVIRDVPEDGCVLIGLICLWQDEQRNKAIGVRGIYRTARGPLQGRMIGQTSKVVSVTNSGIGYALGGVSIPNGSTVEGMAVTTFRDTGTTLDLNNRSTTYVPAGNPKAPMQLRLGFEGSYAVGITATVDDSGRLSGFGLVFAR